MGKINPRSEPGGDSLRISLSKGVATVLSLPLQSILYSPPPMATEIPGEKKNEAYRNDTAQIPAKIALWVKAFAQQA